MSSNSSSTQAKNAKPEDYQNYLDEMFKDLEASYRIARRQTRIWFLLAIELAFIGMMILISFLFILLVVSYSGNAASTTVLIFQFVKDMPVAVAWMAAGISLIFIAGLIYRQVMERNQPIDNYYLGKIQEVKRLSLATTFTPKIETDQKTKDQLNELIIQRILDLLTQETRTENAGTNSTKTKSAPERRFAL